MYLRYYEELLRKIMLVIIALTIVIHLENKINLNSLRISVKIMITVKIQSCRKFFESSVCYLR